MIAQNESKNDKNWIDPKIFLIAAKISMNNQKILLQILPGIALTSVVTTESISKINCLVFTVQEFRSVCTFMYICTMEYRQCKLVWKEKLSQ